MAATVLRRRRARGEATRHAVLQAALTLIARDGIGAVTHRAIAAEAGVALAATTYFFASLQQLFAEAFDLYATHAQAANAPALQRAAALVQRAARSRAARAALQPALLELLVGFMRGELRERAPGLAVEVQYLSLVRPEPALAARIAAYRDALAADIADVLLPLAGASARTDASLLLGAVHRFELDALRAGELPEERVRAELGRLLALILGDAPKAATRAARAPRSAA